MIAVTAHALGSVIAVRARPGAKRDALLGERDGALRVAVTAAPERGRANEAIAELLARALNCRKSRVRLLSGPSSRDKGFVVEGLAPEAVRSRLQALVTPAAP